MTIEKAKYYLANSRSVAHWNEIISEFPIAIRNEIERTGYIVEVLGRDIQQIPRYDSTRRAVRPN